MRATLKLIFLSIFLVSIVFTIEPVRAESEEACAIWLCLPAGFPQGCSGAYSEFRDRLREGHSPLPDLSSCTTGPNGENSRGRYKRGYEKYYPCEDGFELQINSENVSARARCVSELYDLPCAHKDGLQMIYRNENQCCYYYPARRRLEPNYIEMWVDGQYLGKFYW